MQLLAQEYFFQWHCVFVAEDRSISKCDYFLGHCSSSFNFFQAQKFGDFLHFCQQLQGFLLVQALLKVLVLLTGCVKNFLTLMCVCTVFNRGIIVLLSHDPYVTFPMQSESLYLVMETGPAS